LRTGSHDQVLASGEIGFDLAGPKGAVRAHGCVQVRGTEYQPEASLPAQLTPLIGREREVEAACRLLRSDELRLVTLTGPGGVGKTRLAIRVAADLVEGFDGSVFFVSLASVAEPASVACTIAEAVGLREGGRSSLVDELRAFLRNRRLLLVLDNFEHLTPASPLVAGLLADCPLLKVLATSRASLRLSGEQEFPVPPLALPELEACDGAGRILESAAVELFVQRARAVRPDFEITDATARMVAEICARLDGLPLAIELAAARVKLLDAEDMLGRLEHPLELLTGGREDAPARHQTLWATIDLSHGLLDSREQQLFRRLAVFAGGCTLEAAEAVLRVADAAPSEVLGGLMGLLDKNLLRRAEPGSGQARFEMLATVREYALERLAVSGEAEAVRAAHAAYYLAVAEDAEVKLASRQQRRALQRLREEHDNLRAALSWSIDRGEREAALRLCCALWRFWLLGGHLSEGRRWLDASLARSEEGPSALRARALAAAGVLTVYQADYEDAARLCERSLRVARELGDQRMVANALSGLALSAQRAGRPASAREMFAQALAIFRRLGDNGAIARSLEGVGLSAWYEGDYVAARGPLEESVLLFRDLGDRTGAAAVLVHLAGVHMAEGDPEAARARLAEALPIVAELGDRWDTARALLISGRAAVELEAHAEATADLEKALAIFTELGDKLLLSSCALAFARMGAARVAPEHVARLLAAAERTRDAAGAAWPAYLQAQYESERNGARERMSEDEFAAAAAQGSQMTPQEAIAAYRRAAAEAPPSYPAGLTAREVEVLSLVATGVTDAQVAQELVVSLRTVHSHLHSIYRKLGVGSRTAATRYAIERNIVSDAVSVGSTT
jgi:predicted ATPase/DNA-binding CsgD family transcriptional regulator